MRRSTAVFVALVLTLTAALAFAAFTTEEESDTALAANENPQSTSILAACVNKKTKVMTFAGTGSCKRGSTMLRWNATGVAGAQGATGDAGSAGIAGAQGAPGDVGPAGATGTTGTQGVPGPIGPSGPAGPTGGPQFALVDDNSVAISDVVNVDSSGFTVLRGLHFWRYTWFGSLQQSSTIVYFNDTNCTGNAIVPYADYPQVVFGFAVQAGSGTRVFAQNGSINGPFRSKLDAGACVSFAATHMWGYLFTELNGGDIPETYQAPITIIPN